jgi:hypothetical protein
MIALGCRCLVENVLALGMAANLISRQQSNQRDH